MAITIRVGVCRKESTGDYGSIGAECAVDGIEVPAGAAPEELARVRAHWMTWCAATVDEELAALRDGAAPATAPRPAEPARESAPPPRKERVEWGTADHGEAARRKPAGGGNGNGRRGAGGGPDRSEAPRSGSALLARVKDLDEENGTDLYKTVCRWAKGQGNNDRMKDWTPDDVRDGWAVAQERMEALRKSEEFQESLN
jgi:hypothetical protein